MSVRVNDRVRVEPGRDGEIVVMAAWCGKCKCEVMPVRGGECAWCGSRIVDESQLSARAMLGQLRAVRSSDEPRSPEPGPAQPAPTPEGEERRPAGGGARQNGRSKWTREKVIAAIREVGEKVGRTPSGSDMRAHGYGGAYQVSNFTRLNTTWPELVQEAGYEPRQRGDNGKSSGRAARPAPATRQGNTAARPAESEREPQANASADDVGDEPSASPHAGTAAGPASRSDVLLRAVALAARAFADAILEETA